MESIESDSDDEDTSTSTVAIGHLSWGRQESLRTSLTFGARERIRFTVVGEGEVHICGHLVVDQTVDEEDMNHAIAEAGDLEDMNGGLIHIGADSEDSEDDEEFVEVDSDDGETLYEIDADDVMDEDEEDDEEDEEDDEFDGELDSDDGEVFLVEEDSEDDSSDDEVDAAAVRRMLLGEEAGDRPDFSDDDEAEDLALYKAMAAAESDPEESDARFLASKSSQKKRGRASAFDAELSSPNGKRSKHHESHQSKKHQGGYKKHNGGKKHNKF